jgi:hypothetical protein
MQGINGYLYFLCGNPEGMKFILSDSQLFFQFYYIESSMASKAF